MTTYFSSEEIDEIDRLWRARPKGHVWSGWAAIGAPANEVLIFRNRSHWRRFPLVKRMGVYALLDEGGQAVVQAPSLDRLIDGVAAIPGVGEGRVNRMSLT